MNIFLKTIFIICSAGVFSLQHVYAEEPHHNGTQELDEIHELVLQHIKQKIDQQLLEPEINLRKLSANLVLPKCQQPLTLLDSRTEKLAGRMTIRVVCSQPKWQVFVPAIVDGKKPLVKTAKAIIKQAVIKEEDLKLVFVSYKKIPSGSLIDIQKAIGMRAKRAMGADQVIKARDLQPPYWVFKNTQVNIITRIGEIEVKTKGKALNSGIENEQVAVENLTSKKIRNGIVVAPNTVLIP